jgi:hypothetical protein
MVRLSRATASSITIALLWTVIGALVWIAIEVQIIYSRSPAAQPPRATVTGTVTYDGKPVEDGIITFTSLAPGSNSAAEGVIKNGRYRLVHVIPGKNMVRIQSAVKRRRIAGPRGAGNALNKALKLNKNMAPEEALRAAGFAKVIDPIVDAEGNMATIDVPRDGGSQDISLTRPAK